MNRNIALATLSLSLAVQTGIAEAAFTEFAWDFQSGTFAASLQGPAFDSFNNLTGFASPPALTRQAGAYSYTVSAPGNLLVLPQSFGPDPILALSTVSAATTISFTQFTGNASAIGMFIFTTNSDGSLADTNPIFMTATDSASAVFEPLPIDNYVSRGSGFFSLKSDSRIVSFMRSV